MKNSLRLAFGFALLTGIYSGAALSTTSQPTKAAFSDGAAPIPMCDPGTDDPKCLPPLPPDRS
jgi:hypothetical protein